MLNYFRGLHPNIERILDMGFSPPMDPQNLSLEDEKNSYLDAQVSNVLCLCCELCSYLFNHALSECS